MSALRDKFAYGGEGLPAGMHVGPSDRLPVVRGRRGSSSAATADRVEAPSVIVSAAVAKTPPRVRVEEIHLSR